MPDAVNPSLPIAEHEAHAERDRRPARDDAAAQEQGGLLDLRQFVNILKRRYAVILGTTVLVTLLSVIVVLQLTPRYTAEAAVMLDTRKTHIVDIKAVLAGLESDTAVVRSEVEVLRSPDLTARVVDKLHLADNPLINHALATPGFWDRIHPIDFVTGLFSRRDKTPSSDPQSAAAQRLNDLVRSTRGALSVVNDGRSYVIKIQYESVDPALAAKIANAYADQYLLNQLDSKYAATKRATDWLNQQIGELRDKVRTTDEAVQRFRAEHRLTEASKGVTIAGQQLSELNSQLIIATSDRAQKEAQLREAQSALKDGGGGGSDAGGQVLASPLIQNLTMQEAQAMRDEAELATRYLPAHPAMLKARAQVRDIKSKIHEEVGKIVRGMTNDVNAARAREAALRASLQQLQGTIGTQDVSQIQLRELEREADANRTLYENFLNRFKQTSAQEDIQQPDAQLVTRARVPTAPSFPRKTLFIQAALVAALGLGVLLALFLERLDNGFRNGEQIEKLAGLPFLGLVPGLPMTRRPQDLVLQQPISSYSEAIRAIRTAMQFTNVDDPPKIVQITSALPAEGKTVFAVSVARSLARSGGRALLVDCDFRRPSVHKLLGAPRDALGLVAMFRDGVDPQQLIRTDADSGLHYITAGDDTANPQDLLGSQRMKNFLESMRPNYELIVVDTPPVLAVSDALVLSHHVDATLFLIRWEQTPRPIALGALQTFRAQGGRLAGAALARVNVRKHARYGYGDYGYYYGRYGYYYRRKKAY